MEWHTGKRRSSKKEKCKILDKNTGKPGFWWIPANIFAPCFSWPTSIVCLRTAPATSVTVTAEISAHGGTIPFFWVFCSFMTNSAGTPVLEKLIHTTRCFCISHPPALQLLSISGCVAQLSVHEQTSSQDTSQCPEEWAPWTNSFYSLTKPLSFRFWLSDSRLVL